MNGNRRHLSPAQIAPLLGVSESTVKRWVDGGLLRAQKTRGGHRRIGVESLLAFLRATGRPAPSLEALGLAAERTPTTDTAEVLPDHLANLLVADDTAMARMLVLTEYRNGRPMEDLLDGLVGRALWRVGALWAEQRIDVYQEHLATLRAWRILIELRALLPEPPASAPLALGGAPEDDPYVVPTLMAELTLREMAWRTLNLGADVPLASFARATTHHRPRLLWMSLTSRDLHPGFFDDYPHLFETARTAGAAVMLGGQGLGGGVQDRLVATAFGSRVAHLKAFAQGLR